jgi:DNA modification methylase
MKTFILYKRVHQTEIPYKFKDYDTRSYEQVVKLFIEEFSNPGDTILDIFAGLGTVLITAEKFGRIAYGIEIQEEKCEYIVSKIKNKENIIVGDAKKITEYGLPPIDLVYTSPTFMSKHETMNPLTNFTTKAIYTDYLEDIRIIFTNLKECLKPNSHIIVELANLKINGITTLAWDVCKVLSDVYYFKGEVILAFEEPQDRESFGYNHGYCLVFSNRSDLLIS